MLFLYNILFIFYTYSIIVLYVKLNAFNILYNISIHWIQIVILFTLFKLFFFYQTLIVSSQFGERLYKFLCRLKVLNDLKCSTNRLQNVSMIPSVNMVCWTTGKFCETWKILNEVTKLCTSYRKFKLGGASRLL